MLTNNFILKLILTPCIIAAATLVARRYGERIGGLMIGLPLTSGPVSIFFAVEQGPTFAANAARGAMLGLIPVAVFCASYVQSARRVHWKLAAAVSVAAYALTVLVMSYLTLDLGVEVVAVSVALCLAFLLLGQGKMHDQVVRPPWWDLPLRMVIATTLLIAITTAAGGLGSTWAGLLSPFPVFTFVMATFSHSQGGAAAVWRLIRGVLMGLFSYTAFFVVVTLLINHASLWLVYGVATFIALGVNGVALGVVLWRGRRAQHPNAVTPA
jgi:hypothetical protein